MYRMEVSQKQKRSDILGAMASGLCVVHCSLTPLFLAMKPILESTKSGHSTSFAFWSALDFVFLILSLAAVYYSARLTNHNGIRWILWVAWFVFAIGIVSELLHWPYGKWLMYAGSITLVVAHFRNFRYCQAERSFAASNKSHK